MANWKKVIVSGSDAELRNITASSGLKLIRAPHIDSGGLHGNVSTTPLVIDGNGNIHTGSAYALESGGNTVGGSELTSNVAIIGSGGSLIKSASSTDNVNFNSSNLYGITELTASNVLFETLSLGKTGDNFTASVALISGSSGNLEIPSTDFNSLDIKIPTILSNVPGGTSETKVLLLDTNNQIVSRSSSDIGGVTGVKGGTNITVNQQTGDVTASLDSNISLTSVTASAGLFFTSSDAGSKTYTIDYAKVFSSSGALVPSSGSLNISASNINVNGNLDVDGTLDVSGSFVFQGFSFLDSNILSHTGSNAFGQSASLDTHQFTGSVSITGSGLTIQNSAGANVFSFVTNTGTLTTTEFAGGGGSLTDLDASQLTAGTVGADRLNGLGLISQSVQVDGANITNKSATIGGQTITLGATEAHPSFLLDSASGYKTTNLVGTITNTQLAGSIVNSKLVNNTIRITGTSVALGGTASLGDGIISQSSAASSTQGQFVLTTNGSGASAVDLGLQSDDNPTFAGLTLNGGITTTGDAVIGGNLTVQGTTTTFNTHDLAIEDRFIILGSGSATMDDDLDVGIIFDSGSQDGAGMALYYNSSDNRLSIGKGINNVDFTASADGGGATAFAVGSKGEMAGNLVTVKTINNSGTNLVDGVGTGTHSASFGKGEMVIDNANDIWIYSGT